MKRSTHFQKNLIANFKNVKKQKKTLFPSFMVKNTKGKVPEGMTL